LVVGKNAPLPKTRRTPGRPGPLWLRSHAWISKRTLPFELYPLRDAVAKGLFKPAKVEWVDRAGKRFSGTAYYPRSSPLRDQPRVLAVEAQNWPHGRVESEMVNDGRNKEQVGMITHVESLADISLPAVESAPPSVEMHTDELA